MVRDQTCHMCNKEAHLATGGGRRQPKQLTTRVHSLKCRGPQFKNTDAKLYETTVCQISIPFIHYNILQNYREN
jgi:hypothetical protein